MIIIFATPLSSDLGGCEINEVKFINFRFSNSELVYLLKFVCNPQVNNDSTSTAFLSHVQRGKHFGLPDTAIPKQDCGMPSWCSSHYSQVSFVAFLVQYFPHFCAFLVGGLKWL